LRNERQTIIREKLSVDLSRQIDVPQGDRFVCLWSPCKSTRTFGRVAELERHYDEQHVRSRIFDCMAVDCSAKGVRGFARLNKLSIHLETHHSKNTPFLCPYTQCSAGPFPADLLYVHLKLHNRYTQHDYESQIELLSVMCFSCPVQGCMEGTSVYRKLHHLYCHNLDARKRDASAILAAGYSPTSALALCPVCNAELPSGQSRWLTNRTNMEHLLSHDWESLYKYRREILRVRPWFGEAREFKQVFEDIMPTVERADS